MSLFQVLPTGHGLSLLLYQMESDSGNNLIVLGMVPAETSLLSELLNCINISQIASSFIKEFCCKPLFRIQGGKNQKQNLEIVLRDFSNISFNLSYLKINFKEDQLKVCWQEAVFPEK